MSNKTVCTYAAPPTPPALFEIDIMKDFKQATSDNILFTAE